MSNAELSEEEKVIRKPGKQKRTTVKSIRLAFSDSSEFSDLQFLRLTQPPLQLHSQPTRLPLQLFSSCIVSGLR